jgi:hypothetical protein
MATTTMYTAADFVAGHSIQDFILHKADEITSILPDSPFLPHPRDHWQLSDEDVEDLVGAWRETVCESVFDSLAEPLQRACERRWQEVSQWRDPSAARLDAECNDCWLEHLVGDYELVLKAEAEWLRDLMG